MKTSQFQINQNFIKVNRMIPLDPIAWSMQVTLRGKKKLTVQDRQCHTFHHRIFQNKYLYFRI